MNLFRKSIPYNNFQPKRRMFKKTLLLFCFTLISVFSYAQDFDWAYRIGGASTDFGRRIRTDSANNFYVLGFYTGTLVLDSAGSPINLTGFGGTDIFLIKYNCNKVFQWKVKVGGTGNESANFSQCGIQVRNNGDVFITNQFEGTANFVSSNGSTQTISSAGNWDVFTMKLNNKGIIQWVVTASSNGWEESGEVAFDNDGNVCVTGFFSNTCTFSSTSGPSQTLTSAGSTDVFVAKYNSVGSLQFAIRAGSTSQEAPADIEVDAGGNIYTCGNFACCASNSITFGSTTLNNLSSWGGYIAKLSPAGNWLWAVGMGGPGSESFQKIVFNRSQTQMFVIGHAQSTSTISSQAPGTSITITSYGGYDAVVVGLDMNGSLQWAKHLGSSGDEFGMGVSIGADDNPLFTGSFQGNANFDGISATSSGPSSMFVAKFSNSGNIMYLKNAGASGSTVSGNDIHTSSSGLSYVTGSFTNTVNFSNSLSSSGSYDAFVTMFTDVDTTIIIADKLSITCGDSAKLSLSNKTANAYKWFRNDTLISNADSNYIYVKTSGKYKLVVYNNCVNPDTSNLLIITASGFSISKPSNPTICLGDSVKLSISGADSYLWRPANTLSDSVSSNPFAKPITTTKYYLQATKGACTIKDSITVIVSTPAANAGLDKHICLGDSVQLDGVTTGSFAWHPNTNMNNPNAIKPFVKPSNDIKYILSASIGTCVQRDTVEVFVTQVSANAGIDKIVCLGDSVQLDATSLGNVLWQPITFLSNPSLTKPYSKPSSNIDYILTASNGTCIKRDTVKVSMFTSSSADAGSDKRICAGTGVLLSAGSATTYEWTPAYFITNSNSQTPFVNPPIDTSYYLKITLGSCIGFDTVKIKVIPMPTVKAVDDMQVCMDDSVQLNAQVTNANKWVWKSQVQLSDTSILNPKAKITQNSVFIIMASDSSKLCFAYDTLVVNPYPIVKAIYSADTYSGEGQLKPVFNNTSQNATKYNWWFSDSLNSTSKDKNPDFTFIKPGTYKVKLVAKNDYGCMDSTIKEFTVLPNGKLYIPNAFTPNGDMVNEVFKFVYPESAYKRVEMTIYNRWGGFMYETSMPGGKWWDGTFEGSQVPEDVYFYIAKTQKITGETTEYHGTITLLR